MKTQLETTLHKMKEGLFSTETKRWRKVITVIFYSVICVLPVIAFSLIVVFEPGYDQWKAFLFMSILWVCAELVVVWYIYYSDNMPAFARGAIQLNVLIANVWFGLFIFSLNPSGPL
ncbi:hypothetical protein [Microbulbifer sp.]|uniref:hypothetical protein n=1 Tax=Microbulbifer sp. TaxID=1908541 RepID=UPI003F2F2E73